MTYLFKAPKLALSRPFFIRIFHPYRPELHYMRGPGPACRAKLAALKGMSETLTETLTIH